MKIVRESKDKTGMMNEEFIAENVHKDYAKQFVIGFYSRDFDENGEYLYVVEDDYVLRKNYKEEE